MRLSPTISAQVVKENTKGNDGNLYISTKNKIGIQQWKIYKKIINN